VYELLFVFLFYGHMLLLKLIDLFADQLGFLDLLLDLLLVALVQSNLGIKFRTDLIQELVETRSRILRKAAVGIHRHVYRRRCRASRLSMMFDGNVAVMQSRGRLELASRRMSGDATVDATRLVSSDDSEVLPVTIRGPRQTLW
jgi:hypothetical protein